MTEKATRRRFTGEYKRRILREAAACKGPGEVAALLRREGLYSSHLTNWRKEAMHGELAAQKGSLYKRRSLEGLRVQLRA